jgi:FkbM family methyltransferase
MLHLFETYAKKVFRACGLDVRKVSKFETYSSLQNFNIRTILDVGANAGQFAMRIHKLLPAANIYSFEPLADCYAVLRKNMSGVANFKSFNVALGNENGKRSIYHNEFSLSSSLLPMQDLHRQAFPQTVNAKLEDIDICRLDDLSHKLELRDNILVKIDVQGFEDKVIMGGASVIERASVLIVETSFEPLYKGQMLFDGIYAMLTARGFEYKGCEEPLRNPDDGRILQCDSVFVRKSYHGIKN